MECVAGEASVPVKLDNSPTAAMSRCSLHRYPPQVSLLVSTTRRIVCAPPMGSRRGSRQRTSLETAALTGSREIGGLTNQVGRRLRIPRHPVDITLILLRGEKFAF